jgi:hypothetical protein
MDIPVCHTCESNDICIVENTETFYLLKIDADLRGNFIKYGDLTSRHQAGDDFIKCHACGRKFSFKEYLDKVEKDLKKESKN